MHPYFASQETLASRARLTSFVQLLGHVRARVKVSCIQFKTRHGNFRSERKEVMLILVCTQPLGQARATIGYLVYNVNSNMILLCLYIFIECI